MKCYICKEKIMKNPHFVVDRLDNGKMIYASIHEECESWLIECEIKYVPDQGVQRCIFCNQAITKEDQYAHMQVRLDNGHIRDAVMHRACKRQVVKKQLRELREIRDDLMRCYQ